MIYRFIALLIVAFVPSFAIGEDAQVKSNVVSVNKTLTREIDVTGDGIPEQIVLNLRGESWQKPFKWTLTIKAKGKVILKHQADDTWLDTYFADKDYVLDCADYLSCKKKYYEEDILRRLVVIDDDLYRNEHVFDKNNPVSIQIVVRKELIEKYRVSESRASQIVKSMIRRLRSGKRLPILYVPISAVQSNYPIMCVPEIGGFVRVYDW